MTRNPKPLPAARVSAFSDGVYAIAITLLVLQLDVPEPSERLMGELAEDWPSFLGYLVSFVFIGGSWVPHAKLTRSMSNCDDIFVGLTLLKLLFVSLMPFTTSVMANHLADVGERPAVVLFGLNLTLVTVMSVVLSAYAIRTEGVVHEGELPELQMRVRQRRSDTAMFVLSTAVGAFLPLAGVILFLAISAFMLIRPLVRLELRTRRRHQRDWARSDEDRSDDW